MQKSFKKWILKQDKRDDQIGDLARDIKCDIELGAKFSENSEKMKNQLLFKIDNYKVKSILEEAFTEYSIL